MVTRNICFEVEKMAPFRLRVLVSVLLVQFPYAFFVFYHCHLLQFMSPLVLSLLVDFVFHNCNLFGDIYVFAIEIRISLSCF